MTEPRHAVKPAPSDKVTRPARKPGPKGKIRNRLLLSALLLLGMSVGSTLAIWADNSFGVELTAATGHLDLAQVGTGRWAYYPPSAASSATMQPLTDELGHLPIDAMVAPGDSLVWISQWQVTTAGQNIVAEFIVPTQDDLLDGMLWTGDAEHVMRQVSDLDSGLDQLEVAVLAPGTNWAELAIDDIDWQPEAAPLSFVAEDSTELTVLVRIHIANGFSLAELEDAMLEIRDFAPTLRQVRS